MNFKPTLWKSVASVLVGLILYISLIVYLKNSAQIVCITAPCPSFSYTHYLFDFLALHGLFDGFILTYLVWSLFEKKP